MMKTALCRPALLSAWLSLSIIGIFAMTAGAVAQDVPGPLEFEVRPSGVEAETPDDALDRRLKQREALFRSICTRCSTSERFQSNAPFNPIQTLGRPMPD
jgi:hypothetical protein